MATTIFNFSAGALVPDNDGNLDAGDAAAIPEFFNGRPGMVFDDTNEAAVVTPEMATPQGVSGTLTAIVHYFMKTATSGKIDLEVFVEAKTPDSDTLDMETADSWDSVNAANETVPATAGNPASLSITLTNKDSVAAGDLVRFGIRRDADDATNDTATGDLVIMAMEIQEA